MVLLYAYCHCGSSSVVRHCDPQEKGIERLPADGKAGLRMKEGECGIGVSSVDRTDWVAGEARVKIHFSGTNILVAPAPPSVESKLTIFAAQQEINR